jgi:hypothetical protein
VSIGIYEQKGGIQVKIEVSKQTVCLWLFRPGFAVFRFGGGLFAVHGPEIGRAHV